jgi:DNA polymerase III subunit beta
MKLICTQENLKAGLGTVSRIISSVNTLPILSNLLLKTENGQLKISSTNLELAINTNIRCKVEVEGQTTVVAKTFSELVNNLPNDNLTLLQEASDLIIQTENQEFKIKTLPAEEFPFIPQGPTENQFVMEPEVLRSALNQVSFAASTNQTQPEISGIFFSVNAGKQRLAATDRYRLAEKIMEGQGEGEVIIPQKAALELARVLGVNPEKVGVSIAENQIFFNVGATQIISRLVDGQYPDYKSIIPENFNTTMVVDKNKLHGALKTSALFSQGSSSVKLDYSESAQKLTISSESQDLGSGVVDIPSKVLGASGSLLLNFRYVLDFLAQAGGENVVIKVVNDSSPAVFSIEGQTDYLYLVMPIKT